jgi:DNA mismatch repair protein Mlh1 C-terminus
MMVQLLVKKASRLRREYGIAINEDETVTALPELLAGHCPDTDRLPELLIALAADVDWTDEVATCQGIAEVCTGVGWLVCKFPVAWHALRRPVCSIRDTEMKSGACVQALAAMYAVSRVESALPLGNSELLAASIEQRNGQGVALQRDGTGNGSNNQASCQAYGSTAAAAAEAGAVLGNGKLTRCQTIENVSSKPETFATLICWSCSLVARRTVC